MSSKKRLGELLTNTGLITEAQGNQALKAQAGGIRRLGRILLKMDAISSDQLMMKPATVISSQGSTGKVQCLS